MYDVLDSADGAQIGTNSNKVGFGPTVPSPLRTAAVQHIPQNASTGGSIKVYCSNQTPGSVAANSTGETTFTCTGILATDVILACNKPTMQAGLIMLTARVTAANAVKVQYANVTAGTLTPTAGENYNIVVGNGVPTIAATLSPASVAANTTAEQLFTVAPTLPTFTTNLNAAGGVASVNIVSGGSGLATPPTLVFSAGASMFTGSNIASGTAAGLGQATVPQGIGASAIAVLQGGVVVGVQVTNAGSGYTTAPTCTAVGGTGIELGQACYVSFGSAYTAQAGLGIAGSRVTGNNQIGISFINTTAAALTPTASTVFNIWAGNTVPVASNRIVYGVNVGTLASVVSTTTAETTITVNGVSIPDGVVSVVKPTLQAGIGILGARVSTSSGISTTWVNATLTPAGLTPTANEVYAVTVERIAPTAPFVVLTSNFTPTSVAANTSVEQTLTLPSGTLPFSTLGSSVVIQPTGGLNPGLAINARVSAANVLGVTFTNATGTAITPTAGVYTIGSFQMVPGTTALSANTASYVEEDFSGVIYSMSNLTKEVQTSLVTAGFLQGK